MANKPKQLLENSRSVIAKIIGAKSTEIIFTAGGTESVNLAIFGVVRMNTDKNQMNTERLI